MNLPALATAMLAVMAIPAHPSAIVNGDFSLGNMGFSSQYVYNAVNVTAAGAYTLASDPRSVHPAANSFGDHTSGNGLMLLANGAQSGQTIWGQTVAVVPDTEYVFSGWVASWGNNGQGIDPSPATLLVYINDLPVGSYIYAPAADRQWIQFEESWKSASFSQAVVRIVDVNGESYGNDFALDDISITVSVPEPTTVALVGAALLGVVATRRRRATNPHLRL